MSGRRARVVRQPRGQPVGPALRSGRGAAAAAQGGGAGRGGGAQRGAGPQPCGVVGALPGQLRLGARVDVGAPVQGRGAGGRLRRGLVPSRGGGSVSGSPGQAQITEQLGNLATLVKELQENT